MDRSPPGSCPWDFPGKTTGVGCHFLLHWCGLLRIFYMQDDVICRQFQFFHSNLDVFLSPLPSFLARKSVILNRNVKNVPDRTVCSLSMMWAVGFSQMTFIGLTCSLYSQLAECLSWNSIRFCQLLSASIKMITIVLYAINIYVN